MLIRRVCQLLLIVGTVAQAQVPQPPPCLMDPLEAQPTTQIGGVPGLGFDNLLTSSAIVCTDYLAFAGGLSWTDGGATFKARCNIDCGLPFRNDVIQCTLSRREGAGSGKTTKVASYTYQRSMSWWDKTLPYYDNMLKLDNPHRINASKQETVLTSEPTPWGVPVDIRNVSNEMVYDVYEQDLQAYVFNSKNTMESRMTCAGSPLSNKSETRRWYRGADDLQTQTYSSTNDSAIGWKTNMTFSRRIKKQGDPNYQESSITSITRPASAGDLVQNPQALGASQTCSFATTITGCPWNLETAVVCGVVPSAVGGWLMGSKSIACPFVAPGPAPMALLPPL